MARSNLLRNAMLELIFNGTTFGGIARNDAVADAETALTLALHTASPGAGGDQSTNEIVYSGYERLQLLRTPAGWVVTDDEVSPAVDQNFAEMADEDNGLGGIVTHISVGYGDSNQMLYFGTLSPNILVVVGVIPKVESTSVIREAA